MIIGLTGYAQSGKDTVGKILVEEHGFERIAFADALRDCLYALNPIAGPLLGASGVRVGVRELVDNIGWERAKQEYGEVRRLLQVLGTEVGRDIIDPDVWVKIARRRVSYADGSRSGESWANYVFTDVRFPNEVELIQNLGGELWRIERDGIEAANTHSSETALSDLVVNAVIRNHGSILALADLVHLALSGYSK